MTKQHSSYLISSLLVIVPWLSNYRFFFNGLTIGDIILVFTIIISYLSAKEVVQIGRPKKNDSYKLLFVYLLYGLMISMITIAFGYDTRFDLVLRRITKLVLNFTVITYVIPKNIDLVYFEKGYKRIVYISLIAIIIQYFGYYLFNSYIELKIPFLAYSSEAAEQFGYSQSKLFDFRPNSIFLEPSHFTYYVIPYIIIILFKNESNNKIEALSISLLVLMSKSSASLFFLIIIWGYFLAKNIISRKKRASSKIKSTLLILIGLSAIITIFVYSDLFTSYQRINFSLNDGAENVWEKTSFPDEFVKSLNIFELLFGKGFGNYPNPVFATTWNFIIFSTGIIGLLIIIIWVIRTLRYASEVAKVMLYSTLVLFIAWYLIYSSLFILYNVIIINYSYTKVKFLQKKF